MDFTQFQLNELKRFGYFTYPLSKELKNITNFIFENIDSIYSNINEQEISDTEIDPPLIKPKACHFKLYDLFKDKVIEKYYVKDTSIRCQEVSAQPYKSIQYDQYLEAYNSLINTYFQEINEKVFQQEFYTIYYIIKYYHWPKEFHNIQIPRMGFHYDTSMLTNLISSCEGLVLGNNTVPGSNLGVTLTGTGQSLFPNCFHGVNNDTIGKTRYTIASFMLKGKPQ